MLRLLKCVNWDGTTQCRLAALSWSTCAPTPPAHTHKHTRVGVNNAKCKIPHIKYMSKCPNTTCTSAKCSNPQLLKHATARLQLLQCSHAQIPNAQMQKCQILKCSNVQMFKCSNVQLQNANAQMHKCQLHTARLPNAQVHKKAEMHKCTNAEIPSCQTSLSLRHSSSSFRLKSASRFRSNIFSFSTFNCCRWS